MCGFNEENICSSSERLETVVVFINKFKTVKGLPNEILKLFLVGRDLLTTPKKNSANCFHTCRNKYNASMYKRTENKFQESKSMLTEEHSDS